MSISKKYVINNNTRVNISETDIELILAKKILNKIICLTSTLSLVIFNCLYYFSLISVERTEFILITIVLSLIVLFSFTKTLIRFNISQNVVKKSLMLFNIPVFTYKTFEMNGNTVYLKNDERDDPYKLILEHNSNKILRFSSSKTAHTFRKLINKKSQLIHIQEMK
jgi:hypothetical protein